MVAVFGMVFDRSGRLLLVDNADRGWGLPGGGLDGERPDWAWRREVYEETGVVLRGPVQRMGDLVINLSQARHQEWWQYPISTLGLYAARVDEHVDPAPLPRFADEIHRAEWCSPELVELRCSDQYWYAAFRGFCSKMPRCGM